MTGAMFRCCIAGTMVSLSNLKFERSNSYDSIVLLSPGAWSDNRSTAGKTAHRKIPPTAMPAIASTQPPLPNVSRIFWSVTVSPPLRTHLNPVDRLTIDQHECKKDRQVDDRPKKQPACRFMIAMSPKCNASTRKPKPQNGTNDCKQNTR